MRFLNCFPHSFLIIGFASLIETAAAQTPAGLPAGVEPIAPVAPALTYTPGRMISMRPETKRPLLLRAEERNPYARRSPEKEAINDNGENAEELEIRSTLSSLSVTGQSRGPRGLRILLGDIILEEGRVLPPLLPDQSENLQVAEVTEDSVTLAWLDIETGKPTGKTMQMAYDLTPVVAYALHGQQGPDSEEGIAERRMGLHRIGQERKREETRMTEKDPSKRLPTEVYQAGQ